MAAENRTGGYTRIQGAPQNPGHEIGRGTIAKILQDAGRFFDSLVGQPEVDLRGAIQPKSSPGIPATATAAICPLAFCNFGAGGCWAWVFGAGEMADQGICTFYPDQTVGVGWMGSLTT
jgi:hypothetical protein